LLDDKAGVSAGSNVICTLYNDKGQMLGIANCSAKHGANPITIPLDGTVSGIKAFFLDSKTMTPLRPSLYIELR